MTHYPTKICPPVLPKHLIKSFDVCILQTIVELIFMLSYFRMKTARKFLEMVHQTKDPTKQKAKYISISSAVTNFSVSLFEFQSSQIYLLFHFFFIFVMFIFPSFHSNRNFPFGVCVCIFKK